MTRMIFVQSARMCIQGPEDSIVEYSTWVNWIPCLQARLVDLGSEIRDREKRVILTTQLNASFRELAKVITTRTPDIGYYQFFVDLLIRERNI